MSYKFVIPQSERLLSKRASCRSACDAAIAARCSIATGEMKCIDCDNFKIVCKPMMPFEQGLCICKKYNLEADFTNAQKLKRLTCTGGVTERQLNNT